jgi:hypothetical protein
LTQTDPDSPHSEILGNTLARTRLGKELKFSVSPSCLTYALTSDFKEVRKPVFDRLYRLLLFDKVAIESLKSSRVGFGPKATMSCSVNLSFLGIGGLCAASKVVEIFSEELAVAKSAVFSANCSLEMLDLLWLEEKFLAELLTSVRLIKKTLSRVLNSAFEEKRDIR